MPNVSDEERIREWCEEEPGMNINQVEIMTGNLDSEGREQLQIFLDWARRNARALLAMIDAKRKDDQPAWRLRDAQLSAAAAVLFPEETP